MDFENKTMPFPISQKKWKTIGKWIGFLLVVFILLNIISGWLSNYVWAKHLGYEQIYVTIFSTKMALAVIGFIIFFFLTLLLFFNIRRTFLRELADEEIPFFIHHRRLFLWSNFAVSLFVGLIGSLVLEGAGWERVLAYLNQEPFGISDPYFGHDISFFVFSLPMWHFVLNVLLVMFIANIAVKLMFYSINGLLKHSGRAQRHFLVSVILLGFVITAKFLLAPYGTALTDKVNLFQKSAVVGVSFTDQYVNIPFDYIMAGAVLLTTLFVVLAILRRNTAFLGLAILFSAGPLIVGSAASLVVQSFIVSPNEFVREEPFLANNVDMTRKAYKLDQIQVEDKQINDSLSQAMLDRNKDTIGNIRINDTRPLNDVYNQLQTFRPYYSFLDIDIDRYKIGDQYQQVMISARELSQDHLPSQAQTWINRYLRYTHGFGVAISNVNDVTSEGQPEYIVKDLPPDGAIEISRPQIYFGENNYDSVIVNSSVDEFDYPANDDSATHRYEADSGIPLKGFNRLLFAWDEKSYRYLISKQIDSESQLLQTRNIYERVERIAPFLELDSDAYPIIRDDGTIVWMIDAFTMADRYPHSDSGGYPYNYIRNPIKITVDAYTGEVVFYLIDPDEPLAKTYQNMFPDLFTTDVPKDIQAHFRYPEKLFAAQVDLYRAYHMTNLELFYNREDYWQIPTEKYFNEDVQMEPYYMTMKMEDNDEEEFILMSPFSPNKRQNLAAWMGVRNDGEHYGEMFVYTFSKQRNIYGPQQIENRINQDATISQELNLWSQGGSQVIRGNLLVIPIEDTLLYIEPMYIESNNETSLPEVKRIIVAYQDYIVMEPTLEQALQRLITLVEENVPPENAGENTNEEPSAPSVQTPDQLLEEIQSAFDHYREANQAGNYAEAGQALQQIEELLEQWRSRQDGTNGAENGETEQGESNQ